MKKLVLTILLSILTFSIFANNLVICVTNHSQNSKYSHLYAKWHMPQCMIEPDTGSVINFNNDGQWRQMPHMETDGDATTISSTYLNIYTDPGCTQQIAQIFIDDVISIFDNEEATFSAAMLPQDMIIKLEGGYGDDPSMLALNNQGDLVRQQSRTCEPDWIIHIEDKGKSNNDDDKFSIASPTQKNIIIDKNGIKTNI